MIRDRLLGVWSKLVRKWNICESFRRHRHDPALVMTGGTPALHHFSRPLAISTTHSCRKSPTNRASSGRGSVTGSLRDRLKRTLRTLLFRGAEGCCVTWRGRHMPLQAGRVAIPSPSTCSSASPHDTPASGHGFQPNILFVPKLSATEQSLKPARGEGRNVG